MSRSRLEKIVVVCKTCEVSDSFYSSTSVKSFRVTHLGHDVVEGNPDAGMDGRGIESPDGRQLADTMGRARLLKVMVELVVLPSYSTPVFTITGVKDDLKSAFVQVVPPNQRDQVNETLEKGKFLDAGSSDTVYVWDPNAVSFSEEARLAMNFGHEPSESPKALEPNDDSERSALGPILPVAAEPPAIDPPSPGADRLPVLTTTTSRQNETVALLALPVPTESKAQTPDLSPMPDTSFLTQRVPSDDPEIEAQPPSAKPEEKELQAPDKPEQEAAAAVSQSDGSQDSRPEENYLLVSKSWYIESGPKNMNEAYRISRLLRPFRWKVEPAYTIGVIVDDLLSVESATGEIGGDMTKQVEGAGYKLSRVIVEKGKPVAWFMKDTRT